MRTEDRLRGDTRRRLYIPAISIVLGVCLLLVLISLSTVQNLDRDRERALEYSHRQGLTLLRALEAGARTGMSLPDWQEDSIRTLLEETGRDTNVAYLYLYDNEGRILHHSLPSIEGTLSTWQPPIDDDSPTANRLRRTADGALILDIVKRFMPLAPLHAYISPETVKGPNLKPHAHYGSYIVLGLDMDHLEASRKADLHHAFVMGAIVLALGSGALFFIFVIQNYYLVAKTLQSTEDYARKIVASMPSGLLSADAEGRIVTYNQNALELLGVTPKAIRGMPLRRLVDLEKTGIAQALRGRSIVMNHEILYRTPDGQSNPLAVSATALNDEVGRNSGVILLINDLRRIRRLEEKIRHTEKLAALGKLAAGVAHEIRNPLSSIRGFSGYLANALTHRPKEKGYAEVMIREVDRINRVVTDLLTFAKPQHVQAAPVNLSKLIAHTKALVEADADARGIAVTINLPRAMPPIHLDANQLTQALLNLLLNAVQFAPENDGRIEIGARWDSTDRTAHVWVEDNGPGLPADQKNNIFDPFFTTREQGTGLGLAIVHNITANHGGQVAVTSPPPGHPSGTRITLVIPSHNDEVKHASENSNRG